METDNRMSNQSKRELVDRVRHRYLHGSQSEKSRILDEFVAVTGMHRKAAIRALGRGYQQGRERRGRPPVYTGAVVSVLVEVWRIAGCICGKRLAPFLPELVAVLERHGELVVDGQTKGLLLTMSAATIDRKLQRWRQQQGRGISTTKPGTLLKQSIPVRTFADWDDVVPGFMEIDLVAHCGETVEGFYLNTLTATDVATGWTECVLLHERGREAVVAALDHLRPQLPFPLLGIDCDNDSAFINFALKRYCEDNEITFTRSRPYKKNDQAFVEQKNGNIVRQTVGYRRYTSAEASALLETIYADLHDYVNFFQPMLKLVSKQRNGARVTKRYDQARTPHQRVVAWPDQSARVKIRLHHRYRQLNPAALRRHLDATLKNLWQLAE
jgi:hypothetical protein